MNVNAMGTFNVLEAAMRAGVKRVVHSSTAGIQRGPYGGTHSPGPQTFDERSPIEPDRYYGISKLLAEQICEYYSRTTPLEVVVLRYGGVRQLVVAHLEKASVEWACKGTLTDARDAAAANMGAMQTEGLDGATFNVIPTTRPTMAELDAANWDMRRALDAAFPWLAGHDLGDALKPPKWFVDSARAEEMLGFEFQFGQEDVWREALGLQPPVDARYARV
jgi:nucleoside-diphosphate-sugar epimerase